MIATIISFLNKYKWGAKLLSILSGKKLPWILTGLLIVSMVFLFLWKDRQVTKYQAEAQRAGDALALKQTEVNLLLASNETLKIENGALKTQGERNAQDCEDAIAAANKRVQIVYKATTKKPAPGEVMSDETSDDMLNHIDGILDGLRK